MLKSRVFQQRERDSNPRYPVRDTPVFETGPISHSGISPNRGFAAAFRGKLLARRNLRCSPQAGGQSIRVYSNLLALTRLRQAKRQALRVRFSRVHRSVKVPDLFADSAAGWIVVRVG